MKFNTRKTVTFVASAVAGMAAGTLTSMVLKQNTEAVKVSEKVARVVGSFVIGSLVQEKAEKYIGTVCDQVFDAIENIKEGVEVQALENGSEAEEETNEESE